MLDEVQAPATPPVSTLQPIQPPARNIIPPTANSQSKFKFNLLLYVGVTVDLDQVRPSLSKKGSSDEEMDLLHLQHFESNDQCLCETWLFHTYVGTRLEISAGHQSLTGKFFIVAYRTCMTGKFFYNKIRYNVSTNWRHCNLGKLDCWNIKNSLLRTNAWLFWYFREKSNCHRPIPWRPSQWWYFCSSFNCELARLQLLPQLESLWQHDAVTKDDHAIFTTHHYSIHFRYCKHVFEFLACKITNSLAKPLAKIRLKVVSLKPKYVNRIFCYNYNNYWESVSEPQVETWTL